MDALSITGILAGMSASRMRATLGHAEHAAAWIRILAHEGIAEAQVSYGRMLLQGTVFPQSGHDAFKWFMRAASQGDLEAFNMVGRCLENGWGCGIDSSLAAAYYHGAADAGHAWAQYNLGHLYLDGSGVERDRAVAYFYYLKAAALEHARAMNLLGRCCEEGWGTPRDLDAAQSWYRRSAEGGYFRGQYNWASILLRSNCVTQAASWFERAARFGTPAIREAVLRLADLPASPLPMVELAVRLRSSAQ